MPPCSTFCDHIYKIGGRCLESLGIKSKPKPKLEISSPFDFQPGPTIHFPGYSEDDISLMREKAIASTAIVEAEDGDLEHYDRGEISRRDDDARSRGCDYSLGLGIGVGVGVGLEGRVMAYTRRGGGSGSFC